MLDANGKPVTTIAQLLQAAQRGEVVAVTERSIQPGDTAALHGQPSDANSVHHRSKAIPAAVREQCLFGKRKLPTCAGSLLKDKVGCVPDVACSNRCMNPTRSCLISSIAPYRHPDSTVLPASQNGESGGEASSADILACLLERAVARVAALVAAWDAAVRRQARRLANSGSCNFTPRRTASHSTAT